MEDWEEDEELERLNYYVEIGAVELAGIAENGEFIYKITQLAKEIAPELWQAHEEHIDRSLLELYESGMMRVSYDEELNATIELTEEGHQLAKEMGLIQLDMDDEDIPND